MADIKRNINYLNRDFTSFRNTLINYARTYFPETYNDFSTTSPGMMFMEMASYVGDVMSFYLDTQIQETFIQYADQTTNLYDLSYMLGYKPKDTYVSTTDIDIYQTLPASGSGANVAPDFTYALQILDNTTVSTNNNASTVNFIMENGANFAYSSSLDPTEITVLQASGTTPTSYLAKKTRKVYSSTINTTTQTFGSFTAYPTFTIQADNIVGILDIVDSEGNVWYEVDHIAQEMVMDSLRNINTNDPNTYTDGDIDYLLKLKKVQRRFATRLLSRGILQIQFGAGNPNDTDEVIVPNPDNIGMGLPYGKNSLTIAYSPNNFMFTNTYGVAPVNTTLTVRYLTGGGVTSNVQANSINIINNEGVKFINPNLPTATAQAIFNSLYVNNSKASDGGRGGDTPFDLRANGLGSYQSQLRTVTPQDYLIRTLSMPSKYGIVAKSFIEPTKASNMSNNLGTLDMYVLSYNSVKQLTTTSNTLKKNISTYLSTYRSINDSINIKDASIINIGVDFEIITLPNFDNNQILLNCITALRNYFNIDNWQINQPIVLSELFILLDRIKGVQTVKTINITNKTGVSLGYSNNSYDLDGANINNVIYPSLDPSIFEVKYPTRDIQGRVVPL